MNVFSNPIANPNMIENVEVDSRQREVEVGDVFFTTSSETPEEVGMSSVLKKKIGITYLNSFCFGFRPSVKFDLDYLAFMLRSESVRKQIKLLAQGISRFNIAKTKMMYIDIQVPKIDEQIAIGKYFAQLDRLITLHQCNCNMATRPCKWSSGLRAIAWEQRKLGEVAKLNNGKDYKHLGDGNIPVYGTGGYMLSVNQALSYKDDAIGIGRKGTIDKPYILKAPFWTVDTLFYSIPNDKTELNFLFATFQKVDWKAADESTGVPSLSKSTIENIITFFPSLPEQARIGAFFCHLDRLITLHQRKHILLT